MTDKLICTSVLPPPFSLFDTCPEGMSWLVVSQNLCYDPRAGRLYEGSSGAPDLPPANRLTVPCAQLVPCPSCKTKRNWACCHSRHRHGICLFKTEKHLKKHLQKYHTLATAYKEAEAAARNARIKAASASATDSKTSYWELKSLIGANAQNMPEVRDNKNLAASATRPPPWDLEKIAVNVQNLQEVRDHKK